MNIRQFIDKVKEDHLNYLRNRPASEVLVGPAHLIQWSKEFTAAGYHPVDCNPHNWPHIHQWCEHNIGIDHYAWTGSRFYFEKEDDAILFALKWV